MTEAEPTELRRAREGRGPVQNDRARRARVAAVLWCVIAVVVWNGVYDLLMMRAVQEHLARAAMHEAGRGPSVPLSLVMSYAVDDAVWKSTLAASLMLLAGLLTIRYVGRTP
jgi:uncharacterized membrane protein SpoIIM required for sporulation